MSTNHISIVMIAKNAEMTIKNSLESLKEFNEVILYLNNSTDNTETIAREYKNVKVIHGEFLGFGSTKNRAATYAKNDWIFSLDSDEEVLTKLIQELNNIDLTDKEKVFIIKRDNYFLDKEIKHSGWGKDLLTRVYNKSFHQFNDNIVHEFIELKEETIKITLSSSFKHNAVQDVNQFLKKIMSYSDLGAKDQKTCSFFTVILKSTFAFFKTYILQLGFLDGWRGYIIAKSDANGRFYKYTKRYINCKVK